MGNLATITLNDNWSLFRVVEVRSNQVIVESFDVPGENVTLICHDGYCYVEGMEDYPYYIEFTPLPNHLAHVTSMNSMYDILSSGKILSRALTGVTGFSTRGDPNYVYVSLDVPPPLIGKVKFTLSSRILIDRFDYFLNSDWNYAVTSQSLTPQRIAEWIRKTKGPGEILFPSQVDLDPYLEEIVVPQLRPDLVNLIRQSDPTAKLDILDINRIPLKYHHLIRVVY